MNYRFYQTLSILILTICAFCQNGAAQANKWRILNAADVPAAAENLQVFPPQGWKIKTETSGDLNGDNLNDTVLTVAFGDSGLALIVAFKNASGNFKRVAVAPNALRCECGSMLGDGTPDVEISKGQILLKGWSGSREIRDIKMRFRFEASTERFLLIGEDYQLTDRLELTSNTVSSNYLTNQRIFTKIVEDQKPVETKKKIKRQRIYLDELDYQDYWDKFEEN
jgi:hypothetical protein